MAMSHLSCSARNLRQVRFVHSPDCKTHRRLARRACMGCMLGVCVQHVRIPYASSSEPCTHAACNTLTSSSIQSQVCVWRAQDAGPRRAPRSRHCRRCSTATRRGRDRRFSWHRSGCLPHACEGGVRGAHLYSSYIHQSHQCSSPRSSNVLLFGLPLFCCCC